MKRMILKTILTLVSGLVVMVLIVGCNGSCLDGCMVACGFPLEEEYLPEFESDLYRYAVRTSDDGEEICYIVGLTESGQGQTELIFPEYIDGKQVYGIGYHLNPPGAPVWYTEYRGSFESENLQKLYIPYNMDDAEWGKHDIEEWGMWCPNAYTVIWKSLKFQCISWQKGYIVGYNLLPELLDGEDLVGILANVSYMYNYENAQDDGYYWVDSYDSNLISFTPPEPRREGYSFGGWYKEPECINVWNFEADKTGKEIQLQSSDPEDYDVNDITFLYAKWIKN